MKTTLIATTLALSFLFPSIAIAQESTCSLTTEAGRKIDLTSLCQPPKPIKTVQDKLEYAKKLHETSEKIERDLHEHDQNTGPAHIPELYEVHYRRERTHVVPNSSPIKFTTIVEGHNVKRERIEL